MSDESSAALAAITIATLTGERELALAEAAAALKLVDVLTEERGRLIERLASEASDRHIQRVLEAERASLISPPPSPQAAEKIARVRALAAVKGIGQHAALHFLWSRDEGPDYDKESWKEAERHIEGIRS